MLITEFLEARIAEDEAQARTCHELDWYPARKYGVPAVSYNRLLAECAAKRAIIKEWEDPASLQDYDREGAFYASAINQALECLATVYADHPDYQPEWKP